MAIAGRMLMSSGITAAGTGALGFFGASALHLSSVAAMGALAPAVGSVAMAGFAGGLMLYCPVVILRELGRRLGRLTHEYRLFWAALDGAALFGAAPFGAWMLGLTLQPVLICAAVAFTLYMAVSLIADCYYRVPFMSNPGIDHALKSAPENKSFSTTLSLGAYC